MSKVKILLKKNVRIYVLDATPIAQEAMDRHKTLPLASLALSSAIATFGNFAAMKDHRRTNVLLKGNGPLKTILVEVNEMGDIRALVGDPGVITEFDDERFNEIPLTLGIGDGGTLKVVHEVAGITFGGEVPLANGDVVTDLAYYFDQSEQIFTAIVADVKLETAKKLGRAYSVIFQMLPGHDELDTKWVEDFINENKLSEMTLDAYVSNMKAKEVATKETRWKCSCSIEKMEKLSNVLSKKERDEIIKEHGKLEVTCNYCNSKYSLKK